MTQTKLKKYLEKLNISAVGINSGGYLVCPCPFAEFYHERGTDTAPSFNVKISNTGLSGYNCFTCGQRGNMSTLARSLGRLRGEDLRNLSAKATLWEIVSDYGDFDDEDDTSFLTPDEPLDKKAVAGTYPKAFTKKHSRDYLKGRGVSEKTAKALGLLYDPDDCRILFPVISRKGELFGWTGRTILSEFQYPYRKYGKVRDYRFRKSYHLLNEYRMRKGLPTLVVEGLFAVALAVERGIEKYANVVAPMGASLSATQASLLIDWGEPVYLCFDNNSSGKVGMYGQYNKAAGEYEGGGAIDALKNELAVRVCKYPKGIDDPDELTNKQFKRMIKKDFKVI